MEGSSVGDLTMRQPATQYARAGDVNIAYQVVGDGPVDLVWAYGLASNVEVFWEEPSLAAFLRRLAEFSRLITFDRRGCGLSDRGGGLTTPTLEERVDDILRGARHRRLRTGLDPGGVGRIRRSGPVRVDAPRANRPRRVLRLVGRLAGVEHPLGLHDDELLRQFNAALASGWGSDDVAAAMGAPLWAPSMTGSSAGWVATCANR
jgi:hypothetical protein